MRIFSYRHTIRHLTILTVLTFFLTTCSSTRFIYSFVDEFIKDEIQTKKILSIEDITSEFYLRLSMKNESGVLAKITQIFAEHSISIDAMVQKEIQEDDKVVDIILVTSIMIERDVNKIINEIEVLPESQNKAVKLRIEQLNR